jgi:hypothetical protein
MAAHALQLPKWSRVGGPVANYQLARTRQSRGPEEMYCKGESLGKSHIFA